MTARPEDFPRFEGIDFDFFKAWLKDFEEYIDPTISAAFNFDSANIGAHTGVLFEIADRVEEQRVSCHVFHGVDMGELNEMAVLCYWILKLQPFYSLDNKKMNHDINAKVALCIFVRTIKFVKSQNGGKLALTNDVLRNLYYGFRYRNIGRAAMMHLAELSVS